MNEQPILDQAEALQPPAQSPLEQASQLTPEVPVGPITNQAPKPKRSKKPLLLFLLVILLITGAGYGVYTWQHKKVNDLNTRVASLQSQITSLNSQINDLKSAASSSSSADPYAGWKTYTSATEKASFKYPSNWTVTKSASQPTNSSADSAGIKSPSGKVLASWVSFLGGVGGVCDNTARFGSSPSDGRTPCPQINVVSKAPITGASGLFVVAGSITSDGKTYKPWMAVQDSNGALQSKRDILFELFAGRNNGGNSVSFKISGTSWNNTYNSSAKAEAILNGAEAQQAKLILLSLTY